ncbi:chromate transporter [Fusobacterium ulcerans]|nr:chromate transporter [Fusobacterium ulcerans]
MLYLSAFTFGGGFVIVSLMRKKFVKEYHWIEEKEILNLIAIAQSSPGSLSINISILVGYKLAGIPGALISITATALPPLITLSIVSFFYISFKDNVTVNALMKGMQAAIAAIIFDVTFSLAKDVVKRKELIFSLMTIVVFIAVYFFEINIIFIVLVCGAIGAISSGYKFKSQNI